MTITNKGVEIMDNPQALIDLISTVIYIAPVAMLIHKNGKQTQKIEDHETRLKAMERKQEDFNDVKTDIAEIKTAIQYIREAVNEKSTNASKGHC